VRLLDEVADREHHGRRGHAGDGDDPVLLQELVGRGLARLGGLPLVGDHRLDVVAAEPAAPEAAVQLEALQHLVADGLVATRLRQQQPDLRGALGRGFGVVVVA
jgi:hypothetical protein